MTVVLSTVLTLVPILAHSTMELDEWVEQWQHEATEREVVSVEHLAEFLDMRDRHPWYFEYTPPAPTPRRSPAPSQSTVDRSMGTNVEQWRGLVASYFPAGQVDLALCVMLHESGGNPNAKNPTSSARGLFQVLASLWAPHYGVSFSDLYDPTTNVRIAADIWSDYGWSAWSAYNRGKC